MVYISAPAPTIKAADLSLTALARGRALAEGPCPVWAAGGASHMPAFADVIPSYIERVTVLVDDNDTGRAGVEGLAIRLCRDIEARLTPLWRRS